MNKRSVDDLFILLMAFEFASEAHKNQKRKFTNEPYMIHVEETSHLLLEETKGESNTEDFIAALLHDVVEDTPISLNEVGRHFGGEVMALVKELTNDREAITKEGKKEYLSKKINSMTERALTIKLCDRLSNVISLEKPNIPKEFIKRYVEETQYILDGIDRELNKPQGKLTSRIEKMLIFLRLKNSL